MTSNTFEELENQKDQATPAVTQQKQESASQGGEINLDDLSNTAVGDKVKYVRPDLDGSKDVVEKFQVFMPDTANEEPKTSQSGNSKYWTVSMILSYESKNVEGLNNREYVPGAKVFQNKNGGASDIQFWYDGSETQSAQLWELVARTKGVKPDELSPREFVAFLNGKPKVSVYGAIVKNYGAKPGEPKTIKKNMPGEFV